MSGSNQIAMCPSNVSAASSPETQAAAGAAARVGPTVDSACMELMVLSTACRKRPCTSKANFLLNIIFQESADSEGYRRVRRVRRV